MTAQTTFDPGPGPRRGFVGEWGGGAGVIFGPRIFFRFRRETDKSVLIKLNGKKKMRLSAHSIIPITSRLEMEFFSHNQK